MKKGVLALFILTVGAFVFLPLFVRAQSTQQSTNSSETDFFQLMQEQIRGAGQALQDIESGGIQMSVTPPLPEPYSEITVSLTGYGVPINESFISWFIDDKVVRSGIGITSIKAEVGAAGVSRLISVAIEPPNMTPITRSAAIVPGTVDILWETASTRTPPFYRGKSIPHHRSVVKMTTIANIYDTTGAKVPRNNLVYSWSSNNTSDNLPQQSGFGNETAYVAGNVLRKAQLVTVDITSISRNINLNSRTLFVSQDPEIVFYKKEPLSGINYESAVVSNISIRAGESLRIVAEPFSFDIPGDYLDLTFNWKINNDDVQNVGGMHRGEIPLSTQDVGQSRLGLEISSDNFFQKSKNELRVFVE